MATLLSLVSFLMSSEGLVEEGLQDPRRGRVLYSQ